MDLQPNYETLLLFVWILYAYAIITNHSLMKNRGKPFKIAICTLSIPIGISLILVPAIFIEQWALIVRTGSAK